MKNAFLGKYVIFLTINLPWHYLQRRNLFNFDRFVGRFFKIGMKSSISFGQGYKPLIFSKICETVIL